MSWQNNNNNNIDGSDDTEYQFSEKDSILFLIDCRESMFVPIEDKSDENLHTEKSHSTTKRTPFEIAVETAYSTYSDKIISSDSDLVGLCFFNTKSHKNPFDFEHVHLYHDLDIPSANRIRELQRLIGKVEDDLGNNDNTLSQENDSKSDTTSTTSSQHNKTQNSTSMSLKNSSESQSSQNSNNNNNNNTPGNTNSGPSNSRDRLESISSSASVKHSSSQPSNASHFSFGGSTLGTYNRDNLNNNDNTDNIESLDLQNNPPFKSYPKLIEILGGHYNGNAFHDAMWTCQHLFSHVPKNVGFKRIFIFTNEDDPSRGDTASRKRCVERARDLADSEISMDLFAIRDESQQSFDSSIFWKDVISVSDDEYIGRVIFDVAGTIKDMKEKVRRKEFKKRSQASLPFIIGGTDDGPKAELGVQLFNLVMEQKKNAPVWLHADTNQPVKTETKYLCSDTGTELMRATDIKHGFRYGGETIHFEKDQINKIKSFGKPSIKLMGFKPLNRIKVYHNIKHSSFIYPDDLNYPGSDRALAALHLKMLEKQKAAICRLIPRSNALPRYVALMAQEEELDEDQLQVTPPGFHVIYLPFADDIRSLDIHQDVQADENQVYKAKKLVKKLHIEFDSNDFENPALQTHYANLQALALDQPSVEKRKDVLVPDVEGMKQYDDLLQEFKESVYSDDYDPESTGSKSSSTSRKRKASESQEDDSSQGSQRKRRKTNDVDAEDVSDIDWASLAQKGQLNSLRNNELKQYLRWRNLRVGGKKEELIDRITDDLKERELL